VERASSGAWTDPHRYTGAFQGLLRDTGRVITDRVILEWRPSAAQAGVIHPCRENQCERQRAVQREHIGFQGRRLT